MKRPFILNVPNNRKNICYRYGCNHWYLCLKYDPKKEGKNDEDMTKCIGFIGIGEEESYKKYNID